MEQIRRVMRPTDVPDQGLLCDLLWADPDKDVLGWGENDRGVSFTFGADVVAKFLHKHDMDLICRAHQVVSVLYLYFLFFNAYQTFKLFFFYKTDHVTNSCRSFFFFFNIWTPEVFLPLVYSQGTTSRFHPIKGCDEMIQSNRDAAKLQTKP